MAKKSRKPKKRDVKRAAIVEETAALVGVSPTYVRMVLRGERESKSVMDVYMEITEGHNSLIQEVKKLVPFKQASK